MEKVYENENENMWKINVIGVTIYLNKKKLKKIIMLNDNRCYKGSRYKLCFL